MKLFMDSMETKKCFSVSLSITENLLILSEKAKNASLNQVGIKGLPATSFAIKMDSVRITGLFTDQLKHNKHCDYLIVTPRELIFIEMKSKGSTNQLEKLDRNVKQKFQSDICITEYMKEVVVNLAECRDVFSGKKSYFVLFLERLSTSVETLGDNNLKKHNTFKNYGTLQVTNKEEVHYNRLIGKPTPIIQNA